MIDAPVILLYLLLLILPVSAVLARRVPFGTVMKMATIWIGIFGAGALILHVIT